MSKIFISPFQKVKQQPNVTTFIFFLLILAFMVCGVAGTFCPMTAAADQSQGFPANPHHSSSNQQGTCPDQLKSTSEGGKELGADVLVPASYTLLDPLVQIVSQKMTLVSLPPDSSYPLLFLLFSAFLN